MAIKSLRDSPRVFSADIARLLHFIDRPALADELGLDPAVFDDREGKVPVDVWYDVVEAAVEASGDPFLGLHFGNHTQAHFREDNAGAMRLLLLSSGTVRVAVDRAWCYQRYWNEAEWYEVEEHDGLFTWRYASWGPQRPAHVQLAEKMAAHVVRFVRWVVPDAPPAAIRFPHPRRPGDDEVARVLQCQPSYGGSWTEVTFPSSVLDAKLPSADEILFSVLDRQIAERLRDASAELLYADRARKAIADYLHREELTIDDVARILGTSGRTLQRRLNDERTSFRDLMDEVRRSRALSAIDKGASASELVLLLGYSEETAFYRAFRRWTGTTPELWRAQRGADANVTPLFEGAPLRTRVLPQSR
jgi:AraC-like DNA-binding protein